MEDEFTPLNFCCNAIERNKISHWFGYLIFIFMLSVVSVYERPSILKDCLSI